MIVLEKKAWKVPMSYEFGEGATPIWRRYSRTLVKDAIEAM
jgi:hypothetical protein